MGLSAEDIQVLRSMGLEREVGEIVRAATGAAFERVEKFGSGGQVLTAEGFSVAVRDGEEAEEVMKKVQEKLIERGYRAFWSERVTNRGRRRGDEVAVLKTADMYAMVKLCGTGGENYGVMHRDVLDRLKAWEEICAFELAGASRDWVALTFSRLPEKICRFAEEVYTFCPDSVDQGVGLLREPEHAEQFAAARKLCPEVSVKKKPGENGLEKLKARCTPAQRKQLKAQLEMLTRMSRDATPPDMGVRLLAEKIARTRFLFLWWD